MAAPAWLPYALTAFLAVCISVFLQRFAHIVRLLKAGKATEKRWDHLGARVKSFVVNGLLQKKIYRSAAVGLLHSFIFWAFVILGASVVEITAKGYAPRWQLPLPADALYGPLYLAEEIVAVLAMVGIAMALFRRYVVRPKKLMHEGFLDATIVLLFILGIVTSLLLFNASEQALGIAHDASWKPISAFLARVSVVALNPVAFYWVFWTAHVT
ncbi:MAG TPA: hypothetical protein VEM95_06325, partial [Thermoplasmata archaeon]|nr:hypothetical protein [Thermoplasmata archaeon]